MSTQCNINKLSERDRSVLNAILNPIELGGNSSSFDEINHNDFDTPAGLVDHPETDSPELSASIRLESEAVRLAEADGNLKAAIDQLNAALDLTPKRASLFNNRAQIHRLTGNDELALSDLNESLRLSNGGGKAGCKAFCQRGLLMRKQGDIDAAKADFTKAAALGSQFARSQLVALNPYAALCNQMLAQAFEKLS